MKIFGFNVTLLNLFIILWYMQPSNIIASAAACPPDHKDACFTYSSQVPEWGKKKYNQVLSRLSPDYTPSYLQCMYYQFANLLECASQTFDRLILQSEKDDAFDECIQETEKLIQTLWNIIVQDIPQDKSEETRLKYNELVQESLQEIFNDHQELEKFYLHDANDTLRTKIVEKVKTHLEGVVKNDTLQLLATKKSTPTLKADLKHDKVVTIEVMLPLLNITTTSKNNNEEKEKQNKTDLREQKEYVLKKELAIKENYATLLNKHHAALDLFFLTFKNKNETVIKQAIAIETIFQAFNNGAKAAELATILRINKKYAFIQLSVESITQYRKERDAFFQTRTQDLLNFKRLSNQAIQTVVPLFVQESSWRTVLQQEQDEKFESIKTSYQLENLQQKNGLLQSLFDALQAKYDALQTNYCQEQQQNNQLKKTVNNLQEQNRQANSLTKQISNVCSNTQRELETTKNLLFESRQRYTDWQSSNGHSHATAYGLEPQNAQAISNRGYLLFTGQGSNQGDFYNNMHEENGLNYLPTSNDNTSFEALDTPNDSCFGGAEPVVTPEFSLNNSTAVSIRRHDPYKFNVIGPLQADQTP